MVKVFVGPEHKMWFLPENLLCDSIPFFRSAFQSGSKESIEKTIDLPEDRADSFGMLVDWVFTGEFKSHKCEDIQKCECTFDHPDAEHDLKYFGLWILTEKIGLGSLGEKIMNGWSVCQWQKGSGVSAEGLEFAYKDTTEGSLLRKRIVDEAVKNFYNFDHHYVTNDTSTQTMNMEGLAKATTGTQAFTIGFLKAVQEHVMIKLQPGASPRAYPLFCGTESCRIHAQLLLRYDDTTSKKARDGSIW